MTTRPDFWFVMPDPESFVSGGNRYNAELLRALEQSGQRCEALRPDEAAARLAHETPGFCCVDTLHLGAVPELSRRASGRCPVALLAHYLPSLLGQPATDELPALERSSGACATSAFMRRQLVDRGMPESRVFVAEPGQIAVPGPPLPSSPEVGVVALLVANLTEAKGILELLDGLSTELAPSDRLTLYVVGSPLPEPEYAERCRRLAAERPELRERVFFTGALGHEAVLDRMRRSNLFVSASRMEAYGMALAEARVLGLPILARHGGNAAQHVAPGSGGESVTSASELAAALVKLCREPVQHRGRIEQAWAARPPPRPWARVAEDFVAGCQALAGA